MTNTETNTIATNNEENNGEVAEAAAEAEAATNSAELNSSNNGIVSGNSSKSNYVETKNLTHTPSFWQNLSTNSSLFSRGFTICFRLLF